LAKRRLAPVLSSDERAQLARLMLEDVLAVLAGCRWLSGTIVITRDRAVGELARAHGADALADTTVDLNAAVRAVAAFLGSENESGMILVPADIPLLSPSVIEAVVDRISSPRAVALVPATRDGGTNLLACRPADAITPSFGPNSFGRHWQAACDAGLKPVVMTSEDAGLDIDVPEDLAAFLARPSKTRSHAFLTARKINERLESRAGVKRAATHDRSVKEVAR
jgi:2-phospho-L-lactate guanylyltransferase